MHRFAAFSTFDYNLELMGEIMNLDQVLETLPPEIDHSLDELLANWGQARQLPQTQAEAIRREVLGIETELPASWWADYYQRLNATLEKANQVQKNIASSWQLQQLSRLSDQIGWTPRNAPQWQPYLKLT